MRRLLLLTLLFALHLHAAGARIAYIHGDVAADGTVPSGDAEPFHQMRLDDSGRLGLSQFKALVEELGHTIDELYDRETQLTAELLDRYDAIIFGLHQKLWTEPERAALDAWLRAGGAMLIYSDSASGGHYGKVGAQNPVGQQVVNNLIARYGMQITVDQANGVKAFRAGPDTAHPLVADRPILEGEGVSPIAVDPAGDAIVLIPYLEDEAYMVHGKPQLRNTKGVTIEKPQWAALAVAPVGKGTILATFDRQPLWNQGPGSHIGKRDNKLILKRIVQHLTSQRSR